MFTFDSAPLMVGGLLVGLVFGFLLQKGQVAKYAVIVGQFLFVDYTVLKVMLTAIVVGGIGVYAMLQLGLIEGLMIKPAYLAGVGVGGLIFGVGMSSLGYCPGTCVAAAGSGSRHALFGILGGVFGAGVYTEIYPLIDHNFLQLADYGKITFPEMLGVSPWLALAVLATASVGVFAAIERWERRHPHADSPVGSWDSDHPQPETT